MLTVFRRTQRLRIREGEYIVIASKRLQQEHQILTEPMRFKHLMSFGITCIIFYFKKKLGLFFTSELMIGTCKTKFGLLYKKIEKNINAS
jgi:hypothetical protein